MSPRSLHGLTKKQGLQEPGVLVNVVDATIRLGALSWQPETHSLHGLGKTIGWGKSTLLRVTTTHLGALGTESTAVEKTSFLFMPIVMAGMFCLYQHAVLD